MRYPALELGQEGRPACPDAYNEESTLICPGAKRLILQVSPAANVMVQCGIMPQGKGSGVGSVIWQDEEPYYAGAAASLGREIDAVRVRNWKAGEPGEVFVSVA